MDATIFYNEIKRSLNDGAITGDACKGIIEMTKGNLKSLRIDGDMYDDIVFHSLHNCIKYYTKYRDCGNAMKCKMYFNTIIKQSIVECISPISQKQLRREKKLEELLEL
jgi:hypothetical protein